MDKGFHRADARIAPKKEDSQHKDELLQWTSNIVAAYLSKNEVDVRLLPQVLDTVYGKLSALGQLPTEQAPSITFDHLRDLSPVGASATTSDKSITPDYIICLEDGVRLKTLKRYLFRKYKLTPEQYRLKWNLPPDYPMVAPNYAAKRSALARTMGLGRKKKTVTGRKRR